MQSEIFIFFLCGVILQALLQVRNHLDKDTIIKLVGIIFVSLIAFIPGKKEKGFDINFHFMYYCVVFSGLYAFILKDKIIKVINERILLCFTIVFWYVFLTEAKTPIGAKVILAFIAFIFSIMTFINSFVNVKLNTILKVAMYVFI
jgi:hypothetical protein